jgi:hypothetical protein
MKKFLIFLLTLSFVASAFALDLGEGLTLTGEVKSGLKLYTEETDGDDDTANTSIGFYNNDAGAPLRVRLTANYDVDWGGVKVRLQGGPQSIDPKVTGFGPFPLGDNVLVKYAYGWANFLDKKITAYGGKIGDDLWGLGKLSINVFDPALDAGDQTGLRVAFKLIDGLNFGLMFPLTSFANAPAGQEVGAFFGSTIFGVLYTSDFISGAAGLALHPKKDESAPNVNDGIKGYVDVILGLEVKPIAGLTAVVDARIDTRKIERGYAQTKSGYVRIGPKVQYVTGPLTAHLQGDILITNDGKDEISGEDNYAEGGSLERKEQGDATIGLRIGAEYAVTDAIKPYLQIGSDNIAWLTGEDTNRTGNGLYLKPGVVFTISPTASIEIFDKINKLGAKPQVDQILDEYSSITNQFQIDVNWSF